MTGLFNTVAPQGVVYREKARQRELLNNVPSDFRREGKDIPIALAAKRWGRSHSTIEKWRKRCGFIDPNHGKRRAAPADFVEIAADLTLADAQRHWTADHYTVRRWYREHGITPRKFDASEASRAFHAKRKAAQPGQFKFANAGAPVPQADSSLEGRAAEHLRRIGYCNVHHCDEAGHADPKGKFWRVGAIAEPLTGEQLIARAKRKGWSPDDWRVAA